MPTYQYACTACGHQLEVVQSFSDDPLTQCPECEGRLRKLFGSVGVVFKGPGFYRTDSRAGANGGGKNGKSTRGGSAGGDGSGGDGAGAKAKGGDGGGATTSKSSDTASKTTTSSSS
ncbi:MAG TPA: FmdB family zinc ribbon protein [Natronosporangium sp.]|nr:FmdB family zinc ribbon protein [Natronosporangium sp.]